MYNENEHEFFIEPDLDEETRKQTEDDFFSKELESNRERIRLVYFELEKLKITSHYFNKIFLMGYPPHDGDFEEPEIEKSKSYRAKLHEYWGRYSNWHKISPVDTIQSYYGEEVGLYFAFMTVYTGSGLILPYDVIIT